MAARTPMADLYERVAATLQPYGSAERGLLVPMAFGEVELEYAALRRGCVVVDLPHHGTLSITGGDRIDFLNNVVTQELKGLQPYATTRSFWLNRKGRIDADLRLCELGDRMLVDVDALVASDTSASLGEFVFAEDVAIEDASDHLHRMALHGPRASALLEAAADTDQAVAMPDGVAIDLAIRGVRVLVEREDATGEPGFVLTVPADDAAVVYRHLFEAGGGGFEQAASGFDPATADDARNDHAFGLRPAGWMAYNIARIEAGWPLFQIDFDTESLPAETAVLRDRVSFTKGCYLGQEVVARMDALGKPKQLLVALHPEPGAEPHLPIEGAEVLRPDEPDGKPVGTVTSSTVSPMLGARPICFAKVRTAHATEGGALLIRVDGVLAPFVVQPRLRSWPMEA
ncbi:MAG: glycine cleavage T C-terminal barrel domain-containing protein [Planctomycetota bacterium]